MNTNLINIGFGNIISADKIVAIMGPDSAPIKRLVSRARESGTAIDATQGRRTKSVIIMENDRIVLSALLPETIRGRAQGMQTDTQDTETRTDTAGTEDSE